MAKKNILQVLGGEISRMRQGVTAVFGKIMGSPIGRYTLDETQVDYDMARALYDNTAEKYKLGAGFARVVINNRVAFMGAPTLSSKSDKEANLILKTFSEDNKSEFQRITRDALRDGDCYVLVQKNNSEYERTLYPESEERIELIFIDPRAVSIELHPITNVPVKYIVTQTVRWTDDAGNPNQSSIKQIHTKGKIMTELVNGNQPPGVEIGEADTGLDFIPIVHFKNEGSNGVYGQSEIEPIEPFLRIYHDVMLHAMQGSKMHSTPMLGLFLKDQDRFLRSNFPNYQPGSSVSLTGMEMLTFGVDEKAQYIEPTAPIGAAKDLLKLIFYNIVDASETPEFVFGVHTPSSLSSVREQMPILIRSIERKREHFTDSWERLARIVLVLSKEVANPKSYRSEVLWEDIDYRTNEEVAREMQHVVVALNAAVSGELMSVQSAVDYLAGIIHTMNSYESEEVGEGEKDKIDADKADKMRMPDYNELQAEARRLMKEAGMVFDDEEES